LSSKS